MGFSPDWLALREPADRAARDAGLLRRARHLAGDAPLILDLGCGTGATARAFEGHAPGNTQWRMIDSDPVLLAQTRAELSGRAETHLLDLTKVDALPLEDVTLVTASALLDLVSADWLCAFATRLEVPFYAALSYDGAMHWTPADPHDAEITDAFNQHQKTDKGFGPALGPDAATHAAKILHDAGYQVFCADSPWQLGPDMAQLQGELVDGIAQAASEAGAECTKEWHRMRRNNASQTHCVVGHVDLLAVPGAMV